MSRGHDRERDLRRFLESKGYVTLRATGSLGPVDVVAMRLANGPAWHPGGNWDLPRRSLLWFEVKSTTAGPFSNFPPEDREWMIGAARQAGAEPWLAWWPPCQGKRKLDVLRFIAAHEWPGGPAHNRNTNWRAGSVQAVRGPLEIPAP